MSGSPHACLVNSQLHAIAAASERFAAAFCSRLEEAAAASGGPFRGLAAALDKLPRDDANVDDFFLDLMRCGRRHQGLGDAAQCCTAVGIALLDALADVLGDAFDARARNAWSRAFAAAADTMPEAC